jgi:hypothetical protein
MKKLIPLLIAFSTFSAFADSTYECPGNMILKIVRLQKGEMIKLQFPALTGNKLINIQASDYCSDGLPDLASGTKIPDISFPNYCRGFEYPNHEPFFSAENETGEEGYTFIYGKDALEGAKTIKVAEMYWTSYGSLETPVKTFLCRLK